MPEKSISTLTAEITLNYRLLHFLSPRFYYLADYSTTPRTHSATNKATATPVAVAYPPTVGGQKSEVYCKSANNRTCKSK